MGTKVIYEGKQYKVTSINILDDHVKIEADGEVLLVKVKDLHIIKDHKGKNNEVKGK